MDCNICQEEAILALKMQGQGKSLAEIQKAVDQKYVAEYNSVFQTPSPILIKYRNQRLWKPTSAELYAESHAGRKTGTDMQKDKESSRINDLSTATADSAIKQPGRGSCCSHKK